MGSSFGLLYARDLDEEARTQLYYLRRAGDLAPFFHDQWRDTGQVESMLRGVAALPLADVADFVSDPRNPAAAESYVRRALEALLDLGRHVLAKGFAHGPAEYKQVAIELTKVGVLDEAHGRLDIRAVKCGTCCHASPVCLHRIRSIWELRIGKSTLTTSQIVSRSSAR